MPGARGIAQLGALGGDAAQFEWSLVAHEDTDQSGAQQDADAIRQGFNHGGDVRITVQGVRDFGKNFRPAMVFAGSLGQAPRFEQAAELAGNDGCFGSEVLVEEARFGIMDESNRAQDLVRND